MRERKAGISTKNLLRPTKNSTKNLLSLTYTHMHIHTHTHAHTLAHSLELREAAYTEKATTELDCYLNLLINFSSPF